MINALPSEQMALVGRIDPDVTGASTVATVWIEKSKFAGYLARVGAGTLGSSATINAKLIEADDASGTNPQDITGAAITALTQAGTDQSDRDALINLQPDVHGDKDKPFFQLSVTVGAATSDMCAEVWGIGPRYGPASASNIAGVDNIATPTRQ